MKEVTVKDLVKRSTRAFCGVNEKEVTVAARNVAKYAAKLKNAGYYIVGTSYGETPRKKIWFARPGML